jgi:excinuclease ABC subunit B
MKLAIAETERRRKLQTEYNLTHGITPTTISKSIQDILVRKNEEKKSSEKKTVEVMEKGYNLLLPKQRNLLIKELEKQMFEHAKNLEFERAAVIRDEIQRLQNLYDNAKPDIDAE